MKKISLAVLVSLSAITGAAFAQSGEGVTMSTDPAKISDIEQRAQALQSGQANVQSDMPTHKSGAHHKKSGAKHSKKAANAAGASE
ncbi:hypothetical protein AWB64_02382 [Caballeronia sordidicola]|uniref:Uncharacterized protein n=1 Tax=Caballeronia sordidicola TaxID=196367 RepID=A0A158GAC9_CABSO|nr:hypothetical protein [Caballeronia sordidicola]SAL28350.1 hypothetical protein AWB64_02382 [Caballeronia sordidicola]